MLKKKVKMFCVKKQRKKIASKGSVILINNQRVQMKFLYYNKPYVTKVLTGLGDYEVHL